MNYTIQKSQTVKRAHAFDKSGFTLVELMVVIVIIGILTGLVVGALRGAQQDTLAAKTRTTIAKIDVVLNERMDEYLTRSLKFISTPAPTPSSLLPVRYVDKIPINTDRPPRPKIFSTVARRGDSNWAGGVPPTGLMRERVRLAATRDLMRLEMPDRIGDLCSGVYSTGKLIPKLPAILATGFETSFVTPTSAAATQLYMQLEPPSEFLRIIEKINLSSHLLTNEYMNEELLFLIVEGSFVDGEPAISSFHNSEIGDLDQDGLREFLDAWGKPIRWLRWPAGYDSVLPLNPDPLDPVYTATGGSDTDPYDPTRADVGYDPVNSPGGIPIFRPGDGLRPLIISAGSDHEFGVRFFWKQDYLNPAGNAFVRAPLFSPSNVSWPLSSSVPNAPGYFPSVFNWPDPYHPRIDLTTYNPQDYRLGGVLTCGVDLIDVDGEIIGVNPTATPTFIYKSIATGTAAQINAKFATYAGDNVSNLDESGAAP